MRAHEARFLAISAIRGDARRERSTLERLWLGEALLTEVGEVDRGSYVDCFHAIIFAHGRAATRLNSSAMNKSGKKPNEC